MVKLLCIQKYEKKNIFFVKISAKTRFSVTGGGGGGAVAQNYADMSATNNVFFY